jgi:hypothetical protein
MESGRVLKSQYVTIDIIQEPGGEGIAPVYERSAQQQLWPIAT